MTKNKKLFVLLVEDNQDLVYFTKMVFEEGGHRVEVAHSVVEAIKILHDPKNEPEFIHAIVDLHLGSADDGAGYLVLEYIRDVASHRTLATVWTGDTSFGTLRKAVALGARIIFPKPIDPEIVMIQFEGSDLPDVITKASHNTQTGLLNLAKFEEIVLFDLKLAMENSRFLSQKMFSLLSIDADNFGEINKVFGHRSGDDAIKTLAEVFKERFRFGDRICHKSGDEFLIWLPGTELKTAQMIGDTLRAKVAAAELSSADGVRIPLAVSFGTTQVNLAKMAGMPEHERLPWIMEQAEFGPHGLISAKERKKK